MRNSRRGSARREGDVLKGLLAGVAGGLAAAWVMNQFQSAWGELAEGVDKPHGAQSLQQGSPRHGVGRELRERGSDEEQDDAAERVANAVSTGLFDRGLTRGEKRRAGAAVHYAFGVTTGAAYGALAEFSPAVTAGAGLPFGTLVWAAADEGMVPALGLSKSSSEYPLSIHAYALASHLVFGLTAEMVRRGVRARLRKEPARPRPRGAGGRTGGAGRSPKPGGAMKGRRVPSWVSAAAVAGAFGLLAWLERRRPLRRAVEPKLRREARNLAVAAVGAAALQLAERPVVGPLSAFVERRRWGLLKLWRLPAWLETFLAVLLLDYTLYAWHVLTHRRPLLWRLHVAHHVDLDLDASTALRFHFAELVASVPWRAAQVLLIGVSPPALSAWQTFLFLSILFHHSNVRLPLEVERRLSRLVVTPRMHGIHHSLVEGETNSNWSSGLSVWDRLHGTLRLDVPRGAIVIGVPAYRDPAEVTLPKILSMPFGEQRPTWALPEGATPESVQLIHEATRSDTKRI